MYFYFSWSLYTVSLFLTSSFLFRFRLLCQSIIAHKLFDYVVLAFIFSNCITVALERPKILQGSLVRLRPMDLWFSFLTYCFSYWWFPCYPQADILTALTKFQLFPFYSFHNFALFFSPSSSSFCRRGFSSLCPITFSQPYLWGRWHSR